MSISQLWARIRALFTSSQTKGVSKMDGTFDATAATLASLVATASPGIVAVTDSGVGTAAATPAGAVIDSAGAAPVVAAASPGLVASATPVATGAGAVPSLDSDDESESGDELESLKAITGDGVDLLVTVLKGMVSFAMDLGHDFETAYDKSVIHAKALAAKL